MAEFQRVILVHYHEIGLKGHNRSIFEKRLLRNLEALLSAYPLVTIHRIAGSGAGKGIFRECLAYCLARIPNIRIDTHRDNAAMRHLLEKHGFRKCGVIYVEDGSPRIAYQKCL